MQLHQESQMAGKTMQRDCTYSCPKNLIL